MIRRPPSGAWQPPSDDAQPAQWSVQGRRDAAAKVRPGGWIAPSVTDDPEVVKALEADAQAGDPNSDLSSYADRGNETAGNLANWAEVVGGSAGALSAAIPSPAGAGGMLRGAKVAVAKSAADPHSNLVQNFSGIGSSGQGQVAAQGVASEAMGDENSANNQLQAQWDTTHREKAQNNAHDNTVNAISDYLNNPNGYSAKAGGGWTPPTVQGGYKNNPYDPNNSTGVADWQKGNDDTPSIRGLRKLSGGN